MLCHTACLWFSMTVSNSNAFACCRWFWPLSMVCTQLPARWSPTGLRTVPWGLLRLERHSRGAPSTWGFACRLLPQRCSQCGQQRKPQTKACIEHECFQAWRGDRHSSSPYVMLLISVLGALYLHQRWWSSDMRAALSHRVQECFGSVPSQAQPEGSRSGSRTFQMLCPGPSPWLLWLQDPCTAWSVAVINCFRVCHIWWIALNASQFEYASIHASSHACRLVLHVVYATSQHRDFQQTSPSNWQHALLSSIIYIICMINKYWWLEQLLILVNSIGVFVNYYFWAHTIKIISSVLTPKIHFSPDRCTDHIDI